MDDSSPLLGGRDLDRLREALGGFTVDAVETVLGLRGRASLERGDLSGAARALRDAAGSPVADLVALFLLGSELEPGRVAAALDPLSLDAALGAGLVVDSGATLRAGLEIRPYREAGDAPDWWVVSDLGSDVRPGPLDRDHVLGVGSASLTLAQATPRTPVDRALDIGTGCGIQALHLARHSRQVTATDVSRRALQCAATTAALSGQDWELVVGSLTEPVAGRRFDLVVANPPFVVSAGRAGGADAMDYRDSGLAGDAVCERLLHGVPELLTPEGSAVLLANWVVRDGQGWDERIGGWLDGRGCDVWAWQREVAAPEEYVSLWLRDAGWRPGTDGWVQRYDAWCDWFEAAGVAGVGMGLVALWRTGSDPVLVFDDVRQHVEQPVGAELVDWIARARWLRDTPDERLLAARVSPAQELVLDRGSLLGQDGWQVERAVLRQSHGLRWEVEVDEAVASLVAGCAAGAPLSTCLELLAVRAGVDTAQVAAALAPVIRDLVQRGFLVP